jgi:hypothetical protein
MPVTNRKQVAAVSGFPSPSGVHEAPVALCEQPGNVQNLENLPDVQSGAGNGSNRRRHVRLSVRWPAILIQGHSARIAAQVLNISVSGLYCRAPHPVFPGESATVAIRLPQELDPDRGDVYLFCSAVAVRTEVIAAGPTYGMAFRIRDYSLNPPQEGGARSAAEG